MNERTPKSRFLPLIALCVIVLVVGGGAIWLLRNFLAGAAPPQKKVVQEIRIIRPPPEELPPPPPPPPPEEKVDVTEPEQQPDPTPSNEAPPSEQLGLDAEGGAGSDGFGLAGNKGGRDLLASGGSAFTWYAGLLKNEILDRLQEEQQARSGSYSVPVRAWVREDGTIERIELVSTTGDRERDEAIRRVLTKISRLPQGPPAGLPQPMTLRIVSRA